MANKWFGECSVFVSIDKDTKRNITCRATCFAVNESESSFQVEISAIEFDDVENIDVKKIPIASQRLIKAKLMEAVCNKLQSLHGPVENLPGAA